MKRIAILILALAAVTFTAQAQQEQEKTYRGHFKDGKSMNMPRNFGYFGGNGLMIPNLSDTQKEEIKALRLEMAKETGSLRNQIAEKRARLNTLQAEDKADMSAINKTIDEIAALQAQQMKAKANCHVKVRALLDDEQKVAFDNRKAPRSFGYSMSRGMDMGQAKVRLFKFRGTDFDAPEEVEVEVED